MSETGCRYRKIGNSKIHTTFLDSAFHLSGWNFEQAKPKVGMRILERPKESLEKSSGKDLESRNS
jgi:hypothetical protein